MGYSGILEVQLVDARGLRETELFGKMDPYVILQYRSEERKSDVARGQGRNPTWNEIFTFRVEHGGGADDESDLVLRIMDKDTFSADDFVGEATIPLKGLIAVGVQNGIAELKPSEYRVILPDGRYHGEIKVGVTFTPKVQEEKDQDFGGWKQSSKDW
ncbi:hypothetical protein ACLOJK_029977 [Asimina triloba]